MSNPSAIDSPLVTLDALTTSINRINKNNNESEAIPYTPNTMLTLAELKCAGLKELLQQKNADLEELRLFAEYEQISRTEVDQNKNSDQYSVSSIRSSITSDILEETTESLVVTNSVDDSDKSKDNDRKENRLDTILEIEQLKAQNAFLQQSLNYQDSANMKDPLEQNKRKEALATATRQVLRML